MQKTTIPLAALDRILLRVRGLIADLKRQPSEGEVKMVEWLENIIRDNGDDDPVATIIRKIGKLRQGWDRPLTSMEQHSLYGSLDCLREITDPEWEMMGRFLAYTPRMGERLYQVRNRDRFIQDPMNTLGCAEDWNKAHRKSSAPRATPRPTEDNPIPSETPTNEVVREIFKDFLQQ
jgi:hypothetical protein